MIFNIKKVRGIFVKMTLCLIAVFLLVPTLGHTQDYTQDYFDQESVNDPDDPFYSEGFDYAEDPNDPFYSDVPIGDGKTLVPLGKGSTAKSSRTFTLQNPLKVDSVGGLVQNFVEIFSYIAILFAVLALIYVGLRFVLARGDATKMKELKEWLLWIVVGVAVIIGARIIIQVVISTLSASGTVDQRVINSTQNALNTR